MIILEEHIPNIYLFRQVPNFDKDFFANIYYRCAFQTIQHNLVCIILCRVFRARFFTEKWLKIPAQISFGGNFDLGPHFLTQIF